jgi:hypothetical protein
MKALFTTLVLLLLLGSTYSQECVDPDITVVTDCGTVFDLCLDDYTTGMGQAIVLNVTSNDNLGIFDPCDANDITAPANGLLARFDENHPTYPCMYYYTPDQGFIGTDSFYYELNFKDTCTTQCYCVNQPDCPNGKIWTINSMYLDSEPGDVEIYDRFGALLASFTNLEFGDEFFADGCGCPINTTNWDFIQTKNGVVTETEVHTSCSQLIFGVNFGWFRPISGCVSPPQDRADCAGVGAFGQGAQSRAIVDPITTAAADTTIVRITIEPLAIDFLYLKAERSEDDVNISWDHLMSSIPGSLEIQRAVGNGEFVTIGQFLGDDVAERRSFLDTDVKEGILYYRLKATELDGNFIYSRIASVNYKSGDKEIITIFPNPGKGNFNVQWNVDEQQYEWKIFDNLSKMVGQSSATSQADLESQLNNLPQGLYIVSINNAQAEIMIKRVLVY